MTSSRSSTRREPKQQRARETIEIVLDAVPRVLRRHGAAAITTNRVAEAAGVSIGTLYQYFPDKQAIFAALHDRHVDHVRGVLERATAQGSTASLEERTVDLVEQLTHVHSDDAELHEIMSSAVPGSADGFEAALHATFARLIAPAERARFSADESERLLFVLPRMVEALVHGVARRRQGISRERARDEALRTVAVYLGSYQPGAASGG